MWRGCAISFSILQIFPKLSRRASPHGEDVSAQESKKKKAGKAGDASGAGKAGKYVYQFGAKTDGNGSMKPLLGGKGANLAEMCRIGLPVPPGFTITTEVCTYYYAHKRTYPPRCGRRWKRASPPSSVRRARSSAT